MAAAAAAMLQAEILTRSLPPNRGEEKRIPSVLYGVTVYLHQTLYAFFHPRSSSKRGYGIHNDTYTAKINQNKMTNLRKNTLVKSIGSIYLLDRGQRG